MTVEGAYSTDAHYTNHPLMPMWWQELNRLLDVCSFPSEFYNPSPTCDQVFEDEEVASR